MHSFHPSRGRVLLEVFCALTVVASMVGAWRQTEATAFVVAAAAVAVLAMVRLFDLGSNAVAIAEPVGETAVWDDSPPPPIDRPLARQTTVDGDAKEEAGAVRTGSGRRKAGSRKGSGRRSAVKKPAAAQPAPDLTEAQTENSDSATLDAAETSVPRADQQAAAEFAEEATHVPHAPLFEPEPFVRMQRQAFGRRGRL